MRIIVLGYMVRGPIGGMVASNVQYLVGLTRLGHDVAFLEFGGEWDCCYNLDINGMTADPSYGIEFIKRLLMPYGLDERWGYFDAFKKAWLGPLSNSVKEIINNADMVLNLCGVNDLQQGLEDVPLRLLVEEDPVFTQVKHLQDPQRKANAMLHNQFFTFACNWGMPDCTIPDDGIQWQPTRPPVVIDCWPNTTKKSSTQIGHRYTTVMQWRSYPPITWSDKEYHNKDYAFPPYMNLPSKTKVELEIGLAGADANERQKLIDHGWHLTNSGPISKSLPAYAAYLANSRGEFSVAKHGYVTTASGWFSERSACYLACGLPVIVQDTGFTAWLPKDSAIGGFTCPEDAVSHIERIESRYDQYRVQAREIAESYFGSDPVLTDLLDQATKSEAEG